MELTKKGLLLAKRETTYGTDAAPTDSADNIAVLRSQVTLDIAGELIERDILDGGFHRAYGPNVLPEVGIKFRLEMRGNRTDGTTPDISSGGSGQALRIDGLLRCCNLAQTYTAESSGSARDGAVIYKPTVPTGPGDSATVYFHSESKLYKLTGCKGDLAFSLEAGKFGYLDFDLKGMFNPPVDSAFPSTPSWLTTLPPTWDKQSNVVNAQAVTLQNAADTVTLNAHGLFNGDVVMLSGSLPSELTAGLLYYVVNRATNTFKLSLTRGGAAINFTTDGSAVTLTTMPSAVIDGWFGAVVSRLNARLGNQIAKRLDGNATYGVKGFVITGRESTGSINPESVTEATHPFWADWKSGRVKPIHASLGAGVTAGTGNRMNLYVKAVQERINYEDSGGLRIKNISFKTAISAIGESYGEDFTMEFK